MASNCIHYFKRISCLPRPINKVITQFIQVKGILSQSSTSLEKAQYEVTCRYAASLPILPLPLGPAISDREKEAFLTYSLSFPLSDPKVVTRMRLLRADKSSSRSRAKKEGDHLFLSFFLPIQTWNEYWWANYAKAYTYIIHISVEPKKRFLLKIFPFLLSIESEFHQYDAVTTDVDVYLFEHLKRFVLVVSINNRKERTWTDRSTISANSTFRSSSSKA